MVVGTDGSATASEAVRRAADIVRARNGRLHVVVALDALPASPSGFSIAAEHRAIANSPGLVAEHIFKRAATGPAQGIDMATHPESGAVIDALTRVANAVSADVIVVGNKRPTLMPKVIAASIADRLVHDAPCDVLVVNTHGAAA